MSGVLPLNEDTLFKHMQLRDVTFTEWEIDALLEADRTLVQAVAAHNAAAQDAST